MTDVAAEWLTRWDRQQEGYIPLREERFDIMLTAIDVLLDTDDLTIVDLCCGPGSFTQRITRRFPKAQVVAVDLDPVLIELARRAVGDVDGRVRYVEANLADYSWVEQLDITHADAVVSTTALHWLTAGALTDVYRQLAGLIRPGGIFCNGDHLDYGVTAPKLGWLAETVTKQWEQDAFEKNGVADYKQWHDGLAAAIPGLPWDEKERRFAGRRREAIEPGYDLHVAALRDAGFAEVDTIWQVVNNRVIAAVR